MSIVYRPRTMKRRASSKDEFELCYLRHKYFRKTLENPTVEDLARYERVVSSLARNTYYTYRNLLHIVGFNVEDVENIARIHLVSFLGLFALESNPKEYVDFIYSYKHVNGVIPESSEILNKNKANFTLFLKQRMEDLVRICRQKAGNIKGAPADSMLFFSGPKAPPQDINKLIEDYKKYGFKKLDLSSFRTIRKKAGKRTDTKFKYGRRWYVAIPVEYKKLELIDFSGSGLDPYDNIHNMNPEQILFHREEEDYWEKKKEDFRNTSKDDRVEMVSQFVKKNSNNPKFSEEVKIAEKYLKKMGVDLV
jgi:hypothetical protein